MPKCERTLKLHLTATFNTNIELESKWIKITLHIFVNDYFTFYDIRIKFKFLLPSFLIDAFLLPLLL